MEPSPEVDVDVFLWGTPAARPASAKLPAIAARALGGVRAFDSFNSAGEDSDFFAIRDGVLIELRHCEPGGLQVHFADGTSEGRAWTVAHAFLWLVTRNPEISEAVLQGCGSERLRFRDGRITRVATWFSDEVT
ncbi:hypothetical protein GCM10009854_06860 [Saccharopolyspora halophila]|uniref:Uncharacterized protein n=1 Tax=Saccharopolyspora halophila TaxID=405551 RepID=A0ABN3FN41_9PSEU